jgi:hypothetical protein
MDGRVNIVKIKKFTSLETFLRERISSKYKIDEWGKILLRKNIFIYTEIGRVVDDDYVKTDNLDFFNHVKEFCEDYSSKTDKGVSLVFIENVKI